MNITVFVSVLLATLLVSNILAQTNSIVVGNFYHPTIYDGVEQFAAAKKPWYKRWFSWVWSSPAPVQTIIKSYSHVRIV